MKVKLRKKDTCLIGFGIDVSSAICANATPYP